MIYYVYILTNKVKTVLYTGVTNNIERRVFEHKVKRYEGFTARYNVNSLLYYEEFGRVREAIAREKQLKKYCREWKRNLINSMNPDWIDLAAGWYDPEEFDLYRKFDQE